jgi:uncharacterized protein YbjT (DUF2867 family)
VTDSNRILVIGGTGSIGSRVVSQLLAEGAPVRAMVRHPDAAQLPPGIEVVRGDLTIPETLDACLDNAPSVFLLWTAPPESIQPALERIAKHARRIVFLSAPLKTPHPFFQQPNPVRKVPEQIEAVIERSGCDWTFLRPGIFAANSKLWWGSQIRSGGPVRWPYLDVQTAPTDERDIAAVAVRALCDPGHAGAEYVITGPQSLTQREQLSAIGRVIGRPLHIEEISPEEARHELLHIGPLFVVNMLLDAWRASVGLPGFVTSTVAEITRRPAHTFDEWVTENAGTFQA